MGDVRILNLLLPLVLRQIMEEFEDYYPEKPQLIEKERKGGLALTVFSMLLFAFSFMLLFDDNYYFVLLLVVVVGIHEMGHFTFMKIFKYKHVKMLFVPLMGAFVQGKKDVYSQKQSSIVLLAGPIPGIILGVACLLLSESLELPILIQAGILFLFLNILNLVPLDPLDGGQLVRVLFFEKQELFQLIFALISSVAMIGIGFWMGSFILMAFGFLLGFRVRSMQKLYLIHRDLDEDGIKYKSTYKDLTNRQFSLIKSKIMENTPGLKTFADNAPEEKVNEMLATQVDNILIAPSDKDASVFFKIGVLLVWAGAIAATVWSVTLINFNLLFDAF